VEAWLLPAIAMFGVRGPVVKPRFRNPGGTRVKVLVAEYHDREAVEIFNIRRFLSLEG
jgi:hypothetical protein